MPDPRIGSPVELTVEQSHRRLDARMGSNGSLVSCRQASIFIQHLY